MTRLEHRAEMMTATAQAFAALMERNDELAAAIEAAVEQDEMTDELREAHMNFRRDAASVIAQIAVVVSSIDQTSCSMFLASVAGNLAECEIQHNPIALLSELLGGGQ